MVEKMFEIKYLEELIGITVIWIASRIYVGIKKKKFSFAEELKMLMVYICFIVIARIVNFPWHHVDGHIGVLTFDASKIFPLWINVIPIVHLFDIYDGWQMNIIGNVAMFIPVGVVWPICFKKLDNIKKAIAAGAGFSLFIEITQLPFFERCSDIDDIILNTTGFAIGAGIYFLCKKIMGKTENTENKQGSMNL